MSFVPDTYFRKRGIHSRYDNGRGVIINPGPYGAVFYSPAARQQEINASVAAALADPSYFDVSLDPSQLSDNAADAADIDVALANRALRLNVSKRKRYYKNSDLLTPRPVDPSSVAPVASMPFNVVANVTRPTYSRKRTRAFPRNTRGVVYGRTPTGRVRRSPRILSRRLLTAKPVYVLRRKRPLTSVQRARRNRLTYARRAIKSAVYPLPSKRGVYRRVSKYV